MPPPPPDPELAEFVGVELAEDKLGQPPPPPDEPTLGEGVLDDVFASGGNLFDVPPKVPLATTAAS